MTQIVIMIAEKNHIQIIKTDAILANLFRFSNR